MTITLAALFVLSIGADFASWTAFCAHFVSIFLRPGQLMHDIFVHNHAVTNSGLAAQEDFLSDPGKLVHILTRSDGSSDPWTLQ
jgi:hypothetical protein